MSRFPNGFAPILVSTLRVVPVLMVLCSAVLARPALGGEIQDYVRVRGLEGDTLVGIGLVVGLPNTGDAMKDTMIAGQPYAQLLKNLANITATPRDLLKIKTCAIVTVSVTVPDGGARIGQRMDVRVAAIGNAKSLGGGQLVSTMLVPDVMPADRSQWVPYAIADGGPIEVTEDVPTVGTVRVGGRMVRDLVKNPFDGDSVVLILESQYSGYAAATAIADAVNDELLPSGYSDAARVEDSQTIRVTIPDSDRSKRQDFLGRLLTFTVPDDLLRVPARVVIDLRKQVMTVSETVELRPTAVTADLLRITTITPEPQPTPDNPMLDTTAWVGVSTGERNRNSLKLNDLLAALQQMQVPFDTQVAIVEALHDNGALKARIIRR